MPIYEQPTQILTKPYELDEEHAQTVLGTTDENLRTLENQLACDVFVRGTNVTLTGPDHEVARAKRVLEG